MPVLRRYDYDIQPCIKDHRGLYTSSEIEGKHLLVDAHTTNQSSEMRDRSDAEFVIENELVRLSLRGVSKPGYVLVEVGTVDGGEAKASPVSRIDV